ncbi:NADPH-dependent oxidoreductase [Natronospirillum operosum]|uniref:NADPH-dependent oxidoreductase n=1 Tax=Natronospirillum operosum TaxID=2759953 RepID=A0A4Z0W9M9_9GAMM|nr:NAD(P)H-dependent oxidoreductase [Natronospirillum operosum]TGG92033.1 NADPH-dependent oxidoreductase [Natronospirillum operosum]
MTTSKPILVLPGSRRTGAISGRVLAATVARLQDQQVAVDVVQAGDLTAPLYDGDIEQNEGVPAPIIELNRRMDDARALVVVSPEYNGLFPPLLKNTLDWMSRTASDQPGIKVFRGKPVLLIGSSPGANGGLRALPHLRAQMANLGMHVYGPQLAVGQANKKIDEQGQVTDDDLAQRLDNLVAGFVEFAQRLSG